MNPLYFIAIVVMFAGPLLQGLNGATDPNAYVFAPVIAVSTLPVHRGPQGGNALRMAAMFLIIGAICMALWWLGSQSTPPLGWPGLLPTAVTIGGALLALLARIWRR